MGQSEVSVESSRAIGQDGVGEMKIKVHLCCPNPNDQEARLLQGLQMLKFDGNGNLPYT